MSTIETAEAPPVRKPAKKKAKARSRGGAPKVPAEFAGLQPPSGQSHGCCDACNKDRCVISRINVCSHPMKGGLPASLKGDAEALKRFERAKAALKDKIIDLRGR